VHKCPAFSAARSHPRSTGATALLVGGLSKIREGQLARAGAIERSQNFPSSESITVQVVSQFHHFFSLVFASW